MSPELVAFLDAYRRDDNHVWRVQAGDLVNVIDELHELLVKARPCWQCKGKGFTESAAGMARVTCEPCQGTGVMPEVEE